MSGPVRSQGSTQASRSSSSFLSANGMDDSRGGRPGGRSGRASSAPLLLSPGEGRGNLKGKTRRRAAGDGTASLSNGLLNGVHDSSSSSSEEDISGDERAFASGATASGSTQRSIPIARSLGSTTRHQQQQAIAVTTTPFGFFTLMFSPYSSTSASGSIRFAAAERPVLQALEVELPQEGTGQRKRRKRENVKVKKDQSTQTDSARVERGAKRSKVLSREVGPEEMGEPQPAMVLLDKDDGHGQCRKQESEARLMLVETAVGSEVGPHGDAAPLTKENAAAASPAFASHSQQPATASTLASLPTQPTQPVSKPDPPTQQQPPKQPEEEQDLDWKEQLAEQEALILSRKQSEKEKEQEKDGSWGWERGWSPDGEGSPLKRQGEGEMAEGEGEGRAKGGRKGVIFFERLPRTTTKEEIQARFSAAGEIEYVEYTGGGRGKVHFFDFAAALRACDQFDQRPWTSSSSDPSFSEWDKIKVVLNDPTVLDRAIGRERDKRFGFGSGGRESTGMLGRAAGGAAVGGGWASSPPPRQQPRTWGRAGSPHSPPSPFSHLDHRQQQQQQAPPPYSSSLNYPAPPPPPPQQQQPGKHSTSLEDVPLMGLMDYPKDRDGKALPRLLIANMPWMTTEQDVADLALEGGGKVRRVELVRSPTGESIGKSIVDYVHPEAAYEAAEVIQGHDYGGRILRAEVIKVWPAWVRAQGLRNYRPTPVMYC